MHTTAAPVAPASPAPSLPARDADRQRASDALARLASMTAQGRGDDFFRTLARSVAETLQIKYVLIGVLQDPGGARLQTLALWAGDRFAPNGLVDLSGSGCAAAFGQEIHILSRDAGHHCSMLAEHIGPDVESFVGLTLWNSERVPIGLLAIFDPAPFEPSPSQTDVLRILAARAGAEIDRLRASEALAASEERFRMLAEQARDVLWAVELPSRRLAYISPAFGRITGIPAERVQGRLHAVLARIDNRDRRRVVEVLREASLSPTGAYGMEYRVTASDGSQRWIFDQGAVIRDAAGRPCRISGVARDITSRKQAEMALAAERARFRDLFENSPDAVFVESLDGVVLDVNQAACTLHRLPREDLIGRRVTELVPEHARGDVLANFQRLATGETPLAEAISLRSDGTTVPVELRATRVTLPEGRPAVLLHVRDISIRKRAEEFLTGQKRILEWIATGRPIQQVLTELVRVTEARHHGARCWVMWFPDDLEPTPTVLAPTFRYESARLLAGLSARNGWVGRLLAGSRGEPVVARDLTVDGEALRELQSIERTRWHTAVFVPVMARSGPRLGAFAAFIDDAGEPSAALLDLHRLAASLAGVAIERHLADASLREGAERLRHANSALLELARSEAVSKGDLAHSLREISAAASRGIGVSRVSIWLYEDHDTVLRCIALHEDGQALRDVRMELRVSDFPGFFEALSRDRLISVADVDTDPRTADLVGPYLHPLRISSLVDAGIRLHGRLVGIICLEHQGPRRAWKNEEELFAGSVADIVALAVQASERRCIEDALRQSEEAYRSVVGALAEGVMLVNRDGSFATFNDSAADILGLTPEYLRTHRLADTTWATLRPDGRNWESPEYPGEVTLRTGEAVTDSVMGVRRPDGRIVWLSINTRPFARDESGHVSSVVVSFADITRRQEAERALREGHELLQAVSDLQARFIADADPARTFQQMLERLVKMTESHDGIIGEVVWAEGGTRHLRTYPIIEPAAQNKTQVGLYRLLEQVLNASGTIVQNLPAEPAGEGEATTDTIQLLGLPLRHDDEVVGAVALSRRVSSQDEGVIRRLDPLLITCANLIRAMRVARQREQAEARIRQLNAELEQRVEERTADLRSTNEQLAEFAYVVTHDLKAPLRGIHQLSEWLSQDHATQIDAEGQRLLGLLRGRVEHLQRMIDGLLACARVARTPEPESSVATLLLVREIASVLAPPPHIVIEAAPELPVVNGNPDRLHQIFQNLLDNAVKYLDKPAGVVRVSATRRRGAWEFRVADNGPGIPKRYQAKVFQIFQRLDPAGQIPGTGLGLTLVKRIVESRGGTIWIESADGQGTTICFTWPDRARRRSVT